MSLSSLFGEGGNFKSPQGRISHSQPEAELMEFNRVAREVWYFRRWAMDRQVTILFQARDEMFKLSLISQTAQQSAHCDGGRGADHFHARQ